MNSKWLPKDILIELSNELSDSGLTVRVLKDRKFNYKFYLCIEDNNKVFCKNYPEDDLDWLYNKPIMLDFYNNLDEFGLVRGVHYKLYGGGLSCSLVFDDESVIKL